jgi:hypothetical protein
MNEARIRRGQSCAADAQTAVRELHADIAQPDMSLVVFFCSGEYDLAELGVALEDVFRGVPVVGCTTAGEFGPAGYRERTICGASFPAAGFAAATGGVTSLQQFSAGEGRSLARSVVQRLDRLDPGGPENRFGLILIDGMSAREESLTRTVHAALGWVPLVGGSAGDGLRFGKSYVYFDGSFHSDSAALVLIATRSPFMTFKTQHFVPTSERIVVTAADVERRIVSEIDGWPAAEAYARMTGTSVTDLDPECFSAQPMVVVIDGTTYVRSIQKANPDGSLTFFCAIEEGIVLRRAQGLNLLGDLEDAFAQIRTTIGQPQLVIGCDCVLRKLEIAKRGLVDRVDAIFRENGVLGFNSYGEQYGGVHVNQTFTGVAIAGGTDG